jgi:hypothetical protein
MSKKSSAAKNSRSPSPPVQQAITSSSMTAAAAAGPGRATPVSAALQTQSTDGSDDGGGRCEIDSSSASAGAHTSAPTATAAAAASQEENHHQRDERHQNDQQQLDFIVSSHAVKNLFALPYTANDQTISVAIHNLDGTLLIDEDPAAAEPQSHQSFYPQRSTRRSTRRRPRPKPAPPPQLPDRQESPSETGTTEGTLATGNRQEETATALALLPDSENSNNSEALTLVIDSLKHHHQTALTQQAAQALLPVLAAPSSPSSPPLTGTSGNSGLPHPHDYVEPYMPRPAAEEPREYLSWNFQDLNLLVGSNALVFRASSSASHSQQAAAATAATDTPGTTAVGGQQQAMSLTVRVEDAHEMQALMDRHVASLRIMEQQQQQHLLASSSSSSSTKKPISYAQAVQRQPSHSTTAERSGDEEEVAAASNDAEKTDNDDGDDDLSRVRLQTCIVPVPHAPLGGLVEASLMQKQQQRQQQPGGTTPTSADDVVQEDRATMLLSSPAVSTVLDAYLDNIMSNVPQLALCLREKGFIQSVKLLETQDIPSRLLHASTLDTSKPFEIISSSSNNPKNAAAISSTTLAADSTADDEVFSPQIIEMNAATLLRFLQTSCTRNNSTYLLQREKGQSKIQLYDISSISQQKQLKWIWWLAMMSYRFANRLGHIAHIQSKSSDSNNMNDEDNGGNNSSSGGGCSPALLRSFRDRQRSLLNNTLDLLEVLSDMDGMSHESLVAAVREQLADTFLWKDPDGRLPQHETGSTTAVAGFSSTTEATSFFRPTPATAACSLQQPYGGVTVDALNKAHDHLGAGIKYLWPVLERNVLKREHQSAALKKKKQQKKKRSQRLHYKQQQARASPSDSLLTVSEDTSSSSEEEKSGGNDDDDAAAEYDFEIEAVATQLFGLHQKLVNVSLRLAEIHLKNYTSSNAMQSLRTTARRIADALYLVGLLSSSKTDAQETGHSYQQRNMTDWICRLQLQFVWLWEHCGHFARSFAGDQLWRERGHAAADDILIVLQDAEAAIRDHQHLNTLSSKSSRRHTDLPAFDYILHLDPLLEKTSGSVNLHSLSGLVKKKDDDGTTTNGWLTNSTVPPDDHCETAMEAAEKVLAQQRFLRREERKVIIAACIAYSRAVCAYAALRPSNDGILSPPESTLFDPALLGLLLQRLGDACNEAGKILLNELRNLLTSLPTGECGDKAMALAAESLLSSSEFWFSEGLSTFEKCHDLRNVALLRCNLCQCYKLRANAIFASTTKKPCSTADGPTHAEYCLQEAANQLQAAHESLDQRDVDPLCWDMVSTELAATFLVLGVRRRQSLIGSGNVPVFVQGLRLSPGKERSIVDPIQRSLTIYEEAGNFQQAAAVRFSIAS